MTPEEVRAVVKEAVTEVMSQHPCWMSEDDRAMVRDMVKGGKYVKTSILVTLAGAVVYAIAKAVLLVRGA